jgi:DNA-binding beta-propeller fold protein YncE
VNAAEFKQVSKFETYKNYREQADQDGDIIVFDKKSAPEIVDATEDGKTLVYTNSELGSIGFVDISNPSNPIGLGEMYVDGEPTSVAVRGDYAVFGVNTSESYTNPSGKAVMFKVSTQERLFEVPLIGQPDSVAISPDGSFAVIAIENERNEDINDEMIPQLPEGSFSNA